MGQGDAACKSHAVQRISGKTETPAGKDGLKGSGGDRKGKDRRRRGCAGRL